MKALVYTPKGKQKGALTTQVGNGFVTIHPGVNHLEDAQFAGVKKNCKSYFDDGSMKESSAEASKEKKAVAKVDAKKKATKKVAKKVTKKKATKKATKKKAAKK